MTQVELVSRRPFEQPQQAPKQRLEIPDELVERAVLRWIDLMALPAYRSMGLACTPSLTVRLLLKTMLDELDRLDTLPNREARLIEIRAQNTLFAVPTTLVVPEAPEAPEEPEEPEPARSPEPAPARRIRRGSR